MAEEEYKSIFKGKIVAEDGTPLSGVNVTFKSKNNISELIASTGETDISINPTTSDVDIKGNIKENTVTNENGEWEFSFPTTDINPDDLTITFEKENYDLKNITNPTVTSEVTLVLDIPLNEFVPINSLSTFAKNKFEQYEQDNVLVLVRDGRIEAGHPFSKPGSGGRTIGSMYYKGQLIAYTVEDIVRYDKKINLQTAIPAGDYYINLDVTGNDNLTNNYVKLKGKGKYPANWSPNVTKGVFARVGNDNANAVNVINPKFNFGGARIHAGSSENSSAGCIIVSNLRDNKGYLIGNSLAKSFEITKLIYDNDITRIIIIDDFKRRIYKK